MICRNEKSPKLKKKNTKKKVNGYTFTEALANVAPYFVSATNCLSPHLKQIDKIPYHCF